MKASRLYQLAEEEGIDVIEFPLPELESVAITDGVEEVIGLDCAPCTRAQECVRLGHELGHCMYGGFYNQKSPYDIWAQHERRADCWFIQNCIPKHRLQALLEQGYNISEIAEKLDVTEEYVCKAYYYYRDGQP